jgi:hypothetical protein
MAEMPALQSSCPVCIGTRYLDDPLEYSSHIVCPTCNGDGIIQSDPNPRHCAWCEAPVVFGSGAGCIAYECGGGYGFDGDTWSPTSECSKVSNDVAELFKKLAKIARMPIMEALRIKNELDPSLANKLSQYKWDRESKENKNPGDRFENLDL